jgi:hypothetical protein
VPAGSRFALEQYKGLADKKLKEKKVNPDEAKAWEHEGESICSSGGWKQQQLRAQCKDKPRFALRCVVLFSQAQLDAVDQLAPIAKELDCSLAQVCVRRSLLVEADSRCWCVQHSSQTDHMLPLVLRSWRWPGVPRTLASAR